MKDYKEMKEDTNYSYSEFLKKPSLLTPEDKKGQSNNNSAYEYVKYTDKKLRQA